MLFEIEESSDLPLHEQIASQIRRAINERKVKSGERLPPARLLADGLGVNIHTALRAYRALRDEGLIELRRGRGARVAGYAESRARLVESGRNFLKEARRFGLNDQETYAFLKDLGPGRKVP